MDDYSDWESWDLGGGGGGGYQPGDVIGDEVGNQYTYTGSEWVLNSPNTNTDNDNVGDTTISSTNLMPVEGKPGIFYDPEGSGGYVDKDGNPVSATGEKVDAVAKTVYSSELKDINPSVLDLLKNAFKKKDANGNVLGYDWARIAAMAPAAMSLMGLDKKETGGYKGSIPALSAVRQQIAYDDPNRRPGSGGRQYFTDTQYAAKGAEGAAKAVSDAQAAGILSGYTKAAAPTSKWGATASTPAVAMPWVKKAETTTTGISATTGTAADKFMTPEEKLAEVTKAQEPKPVGTTFNIGQVLRTPYDETPTQPVVLNQPDRANLPADFVGPGMVVTKAHGGILAAKGRYLQGPTDGMADEINTSIDGKQPAKLSHGEFVVPADVVSHLGNGNSDAGARKLYAMMDKVRVARTGTKKQGKQINPDKYMPGGSVNKYAKGGITTLPVKKFTGGGATGPATDTTTSSTLSPWAGDYVTNMLGQGQALANQPYQAYKGPLTAGPSDLQQQQFAGISSLASTGLTPTQYSTGTFDTTAAQKYMNPYIQTALDPQLKEMQRQADIARLADASRLTGAGAYGGSRQAIMEAEGRRNLLEKQGAAIGQGYQTAYDKAMQQYNADMGRRLQTEQAQQAANEASAQFGLKSLDALGQAGAAQRAIEAEGIKADKDQFEEQRDWPYKMVQYQQGLLQGLPITTQSNTQNMSALTSLLSNSGYAGQLYDILNKVFNPTAATSNSSTATTNSTGTTNSAGSSGTTVVR